MSNFVIDLETANDEFKRFCEAWELEVDETTMNDEEKVDYSGLKNKVVKAIRKGRLCLMEDDTLEYTISEKTKNEKKTGQKLTIILPEGSSYLGMDRYKENQGVHKFYSVLGAMTSHDPKWFSDLSGIDLKPLQAIVSLFLAE
jgi:hypothetical protein